MGGGGYTQSPGGFGSPAASQGGEKKGVSYCDCFVLQYTGPGRADLCGSDHDL